MVKGQQSILIVKQAIIVKVQQLKLCTFNCAERTIKGHMSSECKMASSILFQGLQPCADERTLSMHQCSVLFNWAIINLFPNMVRWFASSCEGRISLAVLVKVEERNQGSLLLLSLMTDASMVRKHC